jgi:hypothetical protein
MGDLFEDYAAGPAWDEMFDPDGGTAGTPDSLVVEVNITRRA